ncbi:hypothetical protein [Eubacterium sp. An3]|uniref:hypothetical protein n=1 Tax=Eubacterium sp. An3 TaxID=1965628 RepID=UPI000B3AAA52|nr:hypothetical protein [Eubacterium sp. An3]OUO25926.1 hypothetical protein B5F87_16065 [Eubacterium sp. An3]
MIFFLPCILLIGLSLLVAGIMRIQKRSRAKRYITLFSEAFSKTGDIKQTMVQVASCYRKRKKERKALEAGIYYLEHSLLRDYASALSYIYDVFDSSKLNRAIDKCHRQAIQSVQNQRRMLLAPPQK